MSTQTDDTIGARISTLDLGLFATIPSESSDNDKRSLLACQNAMRQLRPEYRYLEIGSYLGGSIQPHLVDPLCSQIVSIDKRPARMPDNRGLTFKYPNNTTERMLERLREVGPDQMEKLACIEGDSRQLDPARVADPIDLAFIDGEHTDDAVLADTRFVRKVMRGDSAIVFHDAQIVYNGLVEVLAELKAEGLDVAAYNLPDYLLVIEVGDAPLHRDPQIAAMLRDNHVGYLASLQANDHYRRIANVPLVRMARSARARLRRTDVSR
jgi:cephalosporin hydroxylase